MLRKFKELSLALKIVVGLIAFAMLPITLLLIGVDLGFNGLKNKKIGKAIGGLALVLFMSPLLIPSYVPSSSTPVNETVENAEQEVKEEIEEEVVEEVINEKPTNINVEINETMEQVDGKVRFNIKTNLPDTAELMVGISKVDGSYRGQTHATVTNGVAQTEWFSDKGSALKGGDYELSISMSMPATQSEKVQSMVGKNGEYLEGSLVVRDNGSAYVSMDKIIIISEAEIKVDESVSSGSDSYGVENTVRSIITGEVASRFRNASLNDLVINENLGTASEDDVVVLAYLSWSTKNSERTTRDMLEMYSDHLAVTLSPKLAEGSEIAVFWDAQYTGLKIKHSYYIENGKAYKQ